MRYSARASDNEGDPSEKDVETEWALLLAEEVVRAVRATSNEMRRHLLVQRLLSEVPPKEADMRRARLEANALRAVRENTEWFTAAQIAELAGLGRSNPAGTVSRWKRQGRIFALQHSGKDLYPKYALGADFQPLPAIKSILGVLRGYDPKLMATWFESTSGFLAGKRPREVIASDPERVLAAAKDTIEGQCP